MEQEIKKILMYLPRHTAEKISSLLEKETSAEKYLTEIRLHSRRPSSVSIGGKNILLFSGEKDVCTQEEISSTLAKLTEDSVHTYSETLREGFISLEGGYRIGVCGSANTSDARIKGLYALTSLCIRIPRAVTGVDGALISRICRGGIIDSALIFSPPGVGKTTLIRSVAASLSSGTAARRVSVIDTRREIYIHEMFKNSIADFLSGYPRAAGIEIATRTLSPEVVICDEIGGADEARAILSAQNTGVPLIATAHGISAADIARRPNIKILLDAGVFRHVVAIRRGGRDGKFEFDFTDTGVA